MDAAEALFQTPAAVEWIRPNASHCWKLVSSCLSKDVASYIAHESLLNPSLTITIFCQLVFRILL